MTDLSQKFSVNDLVLVKRNKSGGAHRIPKYVEGKVGRIAKCYGRVSNPLDHEGIYSPLYSIEFNVKDLFGESSGDKVTVDVHEDSLEPQ